MKKWIFSSGILLGSLLASVVFAQQSTAVKTIKVEPQTLSKQLISIGTILSQRTTYVQTEISGRVVRLDKNVGDRIAKGMTVAKINPEITNDTLIEAKAVQEKAQAAYDAQKNVVGRVKRLVQAHATTLAVLEGEQAKFKVFKADLIASKAQLAKAEFAMKHTDIESTVSGTVQERKVTVGSVIAAGDPVYLIANVSHLKAVLPFPQVDRNLIKLGQSVKLVSPLTKKDVMGKVDGIEPMINPLTRSFSVIVNFKNDQAWHPGSSVTGYLNLDQKQTIFIIPEMSVVNNEEGDYVFVIKKGAAYQVKVKTGNYLPEGMIEILSGLKAGQKIVTQGAAFLESGKPVKEV
jgi:RND family efflux transporter MFP subunit